jgi:Domain of Unknown Function (DUF1080)
MPARSRLALAPLFTLLSASLLLLLSTAPRARAVEPTHPEGFVAIFNGKDLNGWWGATTEDPRKYLAMTPEQFKEKHDASLDDIRKHWRVEDGIIINDGGGLYLTTDKNYRDFELLADYMMFPLGDSGIYLKGCPQVQIWDHTNEKEFKNGAQKGSGGLWNNSPGAPGKDPLVLADKPFGEWNHVRIIQLGSRTTVWLNDKLVVDNAILENYFDKARKLPIPPAGPLQLQTHGDPSRAHGGETRWRNLYVREIGSDEANKMLRGKDPEGFHSIFNGQDLDGWAGPVDDYEVRDGAIVCKPHRGGTIYTKEEFSDFVARLEIKLPKGGNNGLAIRYPGHGDTAYLGMCEIQVLDDNYEKNTGEKIDPRQAHGSAYGMVAAARGYQRPLGEWNYEEVTIKGPTIKVELNGTVILDTDLSKIHDYMGGHEHPGKDRTSGSFGFAGHNDAVMFRDISIQPLK